MLLLSIDCETTGLDPATCQLLEAAFVLDDTEADPLPSVETLPRFVFVVHHPLLVGEAKALEMNTELIAAINDGPGSGRTPASTRFFMGTETERCAGEFRRAFYQERTDETGLGGLQMVPCGKNVAGFDLPFVRDWIEPRWLAHRTVDLGAVALGREPTLFHRDRPPGMADLLSDYTGTSAVKHTALGDALDNLRVLRAMTDNYGRGV